MIGNPFRRRRRAAERTDSAVESSLRRSLATHAFETPDADHLTRRILAATEDAPDWQRAADRPHRAVDERPVRGPWRTWGLPLVAAASVAAVVGIGVAVADYHPGTGKNDAATQVPTSSTHSVAPTTSSPTPDRSGTSTPTGTSRLHNVKILDLTFVGPDDGFALASSQCITTPKQRCTALLQTTDGQKWIATGGTPFDVAGDTAGCPASKCVDHIRFADKSNGFAYGPDAFFVTSDGGTNWTQQSGGAEALETLRGNVIRVRASQAGECLPGCSYTVQIADVGSTAWQTVPLPGGSPGGVGVQLSRGGDNAYLLVTQHVDGGGDTAGSTLYRSSDDGANWVENSSDPCPQSGGEVDSYQVAAGGRNGAKVTVLCRTRLSGPFRIAVSANAGQSFTMRPGTIPFADVHSPGYTDTGGALPTVLAGDPATVLAVAGNGVFISRNGAHTFAQSPDLVGTFASVGFESTTVGRAVSADGSQIWTTRNAGGTWTRATP